MDRRYRVACPECAHRFWSRRDPRRLQCGACGARFCSPDHVLIYDTLAGRDPAPYGTVAGPGPAPYGRRAAPQ